MSCKFHTLYNYYKAVISVIVFGKFVEIFLASVRCQYPVLVIGLFKCDIE